MRNISENEWKRYVERLRKIDQAAADRMQKWIDAHGTEDTDGLIDYAFGTATKYGEASAALACEMYDAAAAAQGARVPPAEPAETATWDETAKAVRGTLRNLQSTVSATVGRLVKQAGADTTLKNARRDGAEFAWVPSGDSCAFCITLASRGWQKQSKKSAKSHAEHIHANCDCEYAVRFDGESTIAGYDPDRYLDMYYAAGGSDSDERIRNLRRELESGKRDQINAQKRAAYARRKEEAESRILKTTADPIREKLGSAYDSHPQETESILDEFGKKGVAVVFRKNAMGYEPSPTPGRPGQVVMDPNASISAWLHERVHVLDDEKTGWNGFRNFTNPEIAAEFESRAYDVEIDFAKSLGYNDIVERLKKLKDIRIKEVLGDAEY